MVGLAHSSDHRGCAFGGDSECHAALPNIRARYVELNGRNTVEPVYACGTFGIVVGRRTCYIDNNVGVIALDGRVDVLAKIGNALVLQADAVEHARRCFGHARIVVAFARTKRRAFHYDAAQTVDIKKIFKFRSVTKRSGSCHHGIFQIQRGYLYS